MSMLARIKKAFSGRIRKQTFTITNAMLTAAAGSQEFEFAAVEPDSIVLSYIVNVTEAFTDGASGVFTIDLGNGTTADTIADGLALGSIAKLVPSAARSVLVATKQLSATVLGTVNVATATAGSVTITVFYIA